MDNSFEMFSGTLTKKKPAGNRIIGAALLFFVFFLPLHFHALNESRQISQECSCYLGSQPQLTSAPSSAVLPFFTPNVFFILNSGAEALVSLRIHSDFARAPPFSLL